jgi:hypothetical protein
MLTPTQLAADAFKLGLRGREVDAVVSTSAPNILSSTPFIGVKLERPEQLFSMFLDADKRFIYGENSKFYFSTYYVYHERCPFARIYAYTLEDIFEIGKLHYRLQQHGYGLPTIAQKQFETAIDIQGHLARVEAYKKNLKRETQAFAIIFEGRREAQITDEGIFLNSPTCLSCKEEREVLMTSSLGGKDGLMVGFYLCTQCQHRASTRSSLLAFLAESFKIRNPFHFRTLSQQEIFDIGKRTLEHSLKCTLQKVDFARFQLTGVRKSGIRVIFRLEGPLNYGYMIFDSNGKQLGRFDSSHDHPELPVQPDHFHYALPDNSKVRSSFLTGVPELDAAVIRMYIEDVEQQS